MSTCPDRHAWRPAYRRVADFVILVRRCLLCGVIEAQASGPAGEGRWHRVAQAAEG